MHLSPTFKFSTLRYGSPSLSLYDGRALALTGNVVVVNINYRVGPLGYLYFNHPDAPGNIGMLDQQLALHWIRENIEGNIYLKYSL